MRSLPAQDRPPVPEGVRVRVTVADTLVPRRTVPRFQTIRGTVLRAGWDSLVLLVHPDAPPLALPLRAVQRVEVSRGVPTRLGSAAGGAVGGAILGALGGALAPSERWRRVRLGTEPDRAALPLPPTSLGVGYGMMGGPRTEGTGVSMQVGLPLARLARGAQLRGELLYQRGEATGPPFDCTLALRAYCFGRAETADLYGANVGAVVILHAGRRWRPYWVPLGVGVYHRRAEAEETQGPTMMCLIDGQLRSCPNNPPWATFRERTRTTRVGLTSGLGVSLRLRGWQPFVETRAHVAPMRGATEAGAAIVAAGVMF